MANNKEQNIIFKLLDGTLVKGDDMVAATIDKSSNDDMLDASMVFDMKNLLTGERIIFPFTSVLYCKFEDKDPSEDA